jgi:hypothetical protein
MHLVIAFVDYLKGSDFGVMPALVGEATLPSFANGNEIIARLDGRKPP